MTDQDPRLIESHVRLCDSKLWQMQYNYFETMGIAAWKEEVPFYISSNAFVARRYALLVFNFMRDWLSQHPQTNHDTFYIAELGSGTGKFSYYFLLALESLLEQHKISDVRFCYVITDVIDNNIKFCQENPCFAPFVSQQVLDFANVNVNTATDFHLILKNQPFSALKNKTPLIIIANYTFDCTKQDIFTINEGKVEEVKLQLRSRYKNFNVEKSQHLDDLRLNYLAEPSDIDKLYSDPVLKQIAQDYVTHFKDKKASILMPLGAMRFFDNMQTLTQNNFIAIIGDKGISSLEEIASMGSEYEPTYDGCYAFLVNFHALGAYMKQKGGDYLLTNNANNFKVNLYGQGVSFNQLIETKAYFDANLESTGPDEYCFIFDEYQSSDYRFTIKGLISFLRFSNWDPDAYVIIHDRLIELMPSAHDIIKADILSDLDKVRNKVYRMNLGEDVYNLLGMFFQSQEQDDKALELYQQSIDVFGNRAAPHNNAAMIYEKQKNITKALYHYQKSYELDKNNRFAKNKILALTGKPYLAAVVPVLKALFVMSLIGIILYYINK